MPGSHVALPYPEIMSARLSLLLLVLLPGWALANTQVQANVDAGASLLPFDGVGTGWFGGVRATTDSGFHAGGGGGVDVLAAIQSTSPQFHLYGAGFIGGTGHPKPWVRVRVEAMVGGGWTTDDGQVGSLGGTAGGPRFQALFRFSTLHYPLSDAALGIGFYVAAGVGLGPAFDTFWMLPQARLGVTFEFGPIRDVPRDD